MYDWSEAQPVQWASTAIATVLAGSRLTAEWKLRFMNDPSWGALLGMTLEINTWKQQHRKQSERDAHRQKAESRFDFRAQSRTLSRGRLESPSFTMRDCFLPLEGRPRLMDSFTEEFLLPATPVYTVKDVTAQIFIQAYANHLKKRGKFVVPKWADLVKTGHGKTLAPHDPDWLFLRAAAMLRHLYLRPSCGVGAFRKVFSCKTGNKCIPGHTSKASGKIIRYILQQFEAMGLVESRPDNGRRLTKVGQKELDVIARQCGVSAPA
ncbi:hypothetical protein Esti_004439 [Eimeria stiedai]